MTYFGKIQSFHDRYPFVGPALWILSIQYFVVQIVVARDWSQAYSYLHNTISDLGNTSCSVYDNRYVCSPDHAVMNASLIVLGFTMLLGATLLYCEFKQTTGSLLGFIGMGLAGLGTILVGLFPENTISSLHFIGALLPFLVGNLSIGWFGHTLDIPKWLRIYSFLTSTVTLLALVFFITHSYLGLGIGGMERIVAYPQTVWLIVFGFYVSSNRFVRARAS
ncbi:MAG TPA: DUF998 domain-containing protein [Candidatus Sulfotelmatobacter sp.]|nr:DUF998 domain-containing protein [Candidatus Sulfotelmatobacter sp.]